LKNLIEVVYKLLFVIGVLCIGVGIMGIFLGGGYVEEYLAAEKQGNQRQVEITAKGTARANGKSTDYLHIKYLGAPKKEKFTFISPTAEEFRSFDKGSIVTIVYDKKDLREAFIIKTPEQVMQLRRKPYLLAAFGLMMIIIAKILGKLHGKL